MDIKLLSAPVSDKIDALWLFQRNGAVMVKMALGALGQRSPIRLTFACPHVVDLG
ncbi:hypothetical protein Tco_1097564, partial [Tanacetum coccineum]